MIFRETTARTFHYVLGIARAESALIRGATSAPGELPVGTRYFLTDDVRSGFGVTQQGVLVGVYSLDKGRGDAIVREAVSQGAYALDCFDGYLVSLYARHGFVEVDREPNWTPGEPDVVYMQLPE